MRTNQEILSKIKEVQNDDWLGAKRNDLITCLKFQDAQQFLKEGVTEKEWNNTYIEPTSENIKNKMADYLDFAFEKAEHKRGLSAMRSMDHYSVWIWLIDEEKRFGDVTDYDSYGIPHLKAIQQYLKEEGILK